MKDPLNKEQTPYEILDLDFDTTEEGINKAFMAGLQKKRNIQKLTRARTILQNKEQRAMLDLFHYDPHVLSGFNPNPIKDKSALDIENRMKTANAWENHLKSVFPDNGVVQTLAVFWYWWAKSEEERFSEALKLGKTKLNHPSSNPPIDQMWHRVVAYWGTLISNLDVWCRGKGLFDSDSKTIENLKKDLESRLVNQFRDFRQTYEKAAEDKDLKAHEERFSRLTLDLTSELRTAREIARVGVRTHRGEICCGRLMLEQVGLLADVRNSVAEALRKKPTSTNLLRLRDVLSSYSLIAILIDNNRPDEALDAINNLPSKERKKSEVKELEARALLERGRQQASLDKTIDALKDLEKAFNTSKDNNLRSKIQSVVVSTCRDKVGSIGEHRPDEAIDILEYGLKIVKDDDLQILLRNLVTDRGIDTFLKAQNKMKEKGITREIIASFESGLVDMKRGAEMGSKKAEENAKTAEEVFKQAKSGFLDLPDEVLRLINEGNKAADSENWDVAVILIRQALNKCGRKSPEKLKKKLATFLTNRAVRDSNAAVKIINNNAKFREEKLKKIFDTLETF